MKVIMISGKRQHGKTTAGDIILQRMEAEGKTVTLVNIAKEPKEMLLEMLGVQKGGLEYLKNNSSVVRTMMQKFATDVMQSKFGKYVWIAPVMDTVLENPPEILIIADWRFKAEYDFVSLSKAVEKVSTLRVVNSNVNNDSVPDQHISETELDDFEVDYTIVSASVEELTNTLQELPL